MKPHVLLILIASTFVVNGQDSQKPQSPMDILCGQMTGGERPSGRVLNPSVMSIELPAYPQKALENHIQGRVWVRVLVDEDGEVIAATPTAGSEHLWAASVKASATARFDPKNLSPEPAKVTGVLQFIFKDGKVELDKMPDPPKTTVPAVRRGIPKP